MNPITHETAEIQRGYVVEDGFETKLYLLILSLLNDLAKLWIF